MRLARRAIVLIVPLAALSAPALAQGSEVPLETVHFEIDYVTTPGDSVFVLGDIPLLGGGDMTLAVKLVPGAYDPGPPASLVWSIDIAIPQGTAYTYQYVVRHDGVSQLSNAANGTAITPPTAASTADPTPLTRQLRFFQNTNVPAAEVSFETAGGSVVVPFRPVPHNPDLKVAVLDGQPNGDGIHAIIAGKPPIETPLHTILRRGGQIYNYVSDPAASIDGTREVFAVPTSLIVSTRTVGGVTGRGVEVWLPRGYATHTDRHYPVLYMHDGQNVFIPGGPFGTWAIEEVAASLIKAGQIRELIIVGIDNSPNRLPEYNPDWSGSQNAAYNSFIVNELKPYVDANYRTLTDAANTGVMGSSFGGIASLALGVGYPDVFGQVGAMSTSFWATDLDDQLAAGELPSVTRLYLDAGDINDGTDDTIAVRDALLASGRVLDANLFFQIGYGQEHNEAAWNARVDEALLALFPITDEQNTIDLPIPGPGDVNADGCVDLTDLGSLLGAYGTCIGEAGYVYGADTDASGCIDLTDLGELLAHYGDGCSP